MPPFRSGFIEPYRRILTIPGAAAFSAAGIVARMPLPMTGLGIVLLLQSRTGHYATAGGVSAVCTLAGAFMAVVQGRWIDRLGQRRILPTGAVVYAAALALLVIGQQRDWPIATAYLCALVAGAALPPLGSSVRARWRHVTADPRDLNTAFALESVNDELVFLIGPLICTFLATSWHAWSGVATAALFSLIGTMAFVAQTRTEPPPRPVEHGEHPPLPWRVLAPLALVCLFLGVLFGAGEVTTVAFAAEHGHRSFAGVPLALWSLRSLVAGLTVGAVHLPGSQRAWVRIFALVLAVVTAPLAFAGSLGWLCVLMTVAGLGISPTMVATVSLAERVLPGQRMTEGITLLFTGMVIGEAPAAVVAGSVIDQHGASTAYLILVGAAIAVAAVAWLLPAQPASPAHSNTVE